MTDIKPGEVLVPASRFTPACEHDDPIVANERKRFGDSYIVETAVWCQTCGADFKEELPTGVEGIPHGQP